MKPHLKWDILTSTATAIPMPASTAIGGGAKRLDDRHGRALRDLVAGARPRLGGGKICQQNPELTPGPCGQGTPYPLVELPGRQPACLEVLT